jgi:hypothetical protein
MIETTLTDIENWSKDDSIDIVRTKLLSKLAIIELCGWLEEWMDDFIREIDTLTIVDPKWVQSNLIDRTNGFHYDKHFRPMVCGMVGEHLVRKIEDDFEQNGGGDFESLKSTLGDLWKRRCLLAHADLQAHQRAQITIMGPSWTKNQYRVLRKRLESLKAIAQAQLES